MNEINISMFTASNIVKKYYEESFSNIAKIEVKPKLENNDLLMVIKNKTKVNNKTIIVSETINEGKISSIIKEYMKKRNCYIENIMYEPYFHNLNIRYNGEFNLVEKKKGFMKIKKAA